jgi:ATP/ADP translocase
MRTTTVTTVGFPVQLLSPSSGSSAVPVHTKFACLLCTPIANTIRYKHSQLSSLAPIVAGQVVVRAAAARGATFDKTLPFLTVLVAVSGAAVFACYEATRAVVRLQTTAAATAAASSSLLKRSTTAAAAAAAPAAAAAVAGGKKLKKPKLGLRDSFAVLSRSPYLGCLATMVLGYGLSINLTEVMWKSLVRRRYPDSLAYQVSAMLLLLLLPASTHATMNTNVMSYTRANSMRPC